MDKDIGKISKNADTDIVIRVDDYGGKRGVTIREFLRGERYTGFTKAGTRIPADKFKEFKEAINSIDENELLGMAESMEIGNGENNAGKGKASAGRKEFNSGKQEKIKDIEEEVF
ncbi:hypothetical protein HYV50_00750 [Candidatus Pacearchaeota archaeon]|nr:hypothetical protein [Candidatus Pacearchaeota archaeon]